MQEFNLNKATAALLAFCYVQLPAFTNAQDSLRGVRYRNETVHDSLSHASMAGGMELFIDGSGMDEQSHLNQVLFASDTQSDVELAGTLQDIDDEIQSSTSVGRLAYTLPPLTDLFGGVPISAMNQHFTSNSENEAIGFTLKVSNTADDSVVECKTGSEYKCKVQYRLRYTPMLFDISPSNVYHDQMLSIYINPMETQHQNVIKDGADPVDFIKFDGTRTDSEDLFDSDTRLSSWTVSTLPTRSGDQHPGNQIPEVRFRTGNAFLRDSAQHCNFAGDDCWYVRTHPKIDSISASQGYTSGGQQMKLKGWGLKGTSLDDVTVLVDGVACQVTSSTLEEVNCVTGAASVASNDGVSQPGSPGLTHQKLQPSGSWPSWSTRTDGTVYETVLHTAFESNYNALYRDAAVSKGWFKAPATGNYRFYISCDEACQLFVDETTPFDQVTPVAPTLVEKAKCSSAREWRHYFMSVDTSEAVSDWVPLSEGEFYKIEGFMFEYTGTDHFTVSVEFEQEDTTGHQHANKEIQVLRIEHEVNSAEIFIIDVDGPMGSNFKIQFVDPKFNPANQEPQEMFWVSEEIADDCSSSSMKNRIKGFFSSVWGSDISVAKQGYDMMGEETSDESDIFRAVFTVTILKRIDGPSFTSAAVLQDGPGAVVTVTLSQESTAPLAGNFVITCPDEQGNDWSTKEFGFTQWTQTLDFWMQLFIPHLQFKIYVRDINEHTYRENGVGFAVIFQDYHGDVPECTISSGSDSPLTGNNPLFSTVTEREYGKNLMFEPIPLSMLYTDAQKPQVLLTVNGIEGVCPSFNCDYVYVDTTSVISSQSISGEEVTILGTNLPTGNDVKVMLGSSECEITYVTQTEMYCEMATSAAAGTWNVQVTDANGLIPIQDGVATIEISLVIASVSPATDLNQLGGDTLLIEGSGFDTSSDSTSVLFDDGTECDIIYTHSLGLECTVAGFDKVALHAATPYSVTVSVNGVSDSSLSVNILSEKQVGTSVEPSSVSPVLSRNLTVALDSDYPHTLIAEDFSAKLVLASNRSFTRPLFVVAVDDSTKTLVLKFPGAESGSYRVQLSSTQIGRIDEEPLELEVIGKITSFQPTSGSALGGTLVTIDGINFSDDPLDNPVKVGNNYCDVMTTSASQITCRVRETGVTDPSETNLLVFLRTSEEAQIEISDAFTFVDPISTITDMTNAFDSATNQHTFTVSGTGFPSEDGINAASLWIDGIEQQTLTLSNTEATFAITDIVTSTPSSVRVYFADGLPTGFDAFTTATIVPTLVSISPSTGSSGGTLLTVTGTGFGTSSEELNLNHSSGEDICETVTITGYGTFTCLTKAMEIQSSDSLNLKVGSDLFSCGNSLDTSVCYFQQVDLSSPSVTAATVSDASSIQFTGTDFPTSDYDAVATFMGVESSSALINSAGEVVATFEHGVPLSLTASSPMLSFKHQTLNEQLIANQGGIGLTNAAVISDSTTGLSCSFQGGCAYTVTATGLTSNLLNSSTNSIDVCGNPCLIDTSASSATQTVCKLPYVATAYSAEQFQIVTAGMLHDGTWTGSASQSELAKLIDGKNMVDIEDSSSTCYFQIQYKENHVGVLDEVKFFINEMIDKSAYNGSLVFQGSDDGTEFTDLWTVDAGVHEGWNAHDFEEGNKPSFNIYRFAGSDPGSCRIGEVKLHGIESIDSDLTTHTCTPKLILEGEVTQLNPVTYDAALTPVLTGMSKRYGSVLGGETVEFYGTGFSSSATTTVMIDSRPCSVTAQSTTSITCITDDKPNIVAEDSTLVIDIDGLGNVVTKNQVYRYVSRWSDSQTWGYDLSPLEGEAVYIPLGQHLLVDVDSTPILSFINVEGSLIFAPETDPNHERYFDCQYILVKGGYMEVGTEEHRYTSKLTITMHGSKYTPNLPIFGNKVIGVNYGTLEMHGNLRSHTWTDLKETAEVGATSIKLNDITGGVPLDWQVGEDIVIASTDISGRNAEQRTITAITDIGTNPVVTFSQALEFKHYAGIQYFGTEFIEMRAEVGLLSRNVKYQGDPETSPDAQYGAVIIMHSPGDESTQGRIDGIELTNVGQAFILGSYPIHFHMIGTVHNSYVRNNAIHHTFNRAVTIHGVHYLKVQNNVAYHTMGHTIFIEDAAETKNLIEDNLVLDVRRSWSLLNTDQTPACFWITNPDNIFRRNHAAGSDRYSYWFDTQKTAIGPSFDENICPENTKLGEFTDNVAHSNGRYGLRIFHNLIPRTYPCESMVYDGTDPTNPYPNNPPIIAEFHNLVSYKNGRNGAIAERVGAVQFHNFKTADNVLAGIEFSLTEDIVDGFAKIVGGLVVGRTENSSEEIDQGSPHGIITPRTENFAIEGTKFYNYNWNNAAGLGTCSHCFHPAATDSGARTVRVNALQFDTDSVTKRIMYQYPQRAIFYDETGSLTNQGAGSWATPYWKHNDQPECTVDNAVFNGITCPNTVQVRRIAFSGYSPAHFDGMEMKIAKFDKSDMSPLESAGTLQDYLDSGDNYSKVFFKSKQKPSNGWAMPFVTGHKYRIHWAEGLDFERMEFEVSERWQETDLNTFINMNFTETREAVNFTSSGEQLMNTTLITKSNVALETGDNWVRNDTETRYIDFVVNGKNSAKSKILMEGLRCLTGVCPLDEVIEYPIEDGQRLWSNPESWGGQLPEEGDDVEIPSGWNMLLDLEETPILNSLTINGRLSFIQNMTSINLRSKYIFVRAGEFFIGTETEPFQNEAKITLIGDQDSETLVLSGTVSAGNKILATVGDVKFYGKERSRWTRLEAPVYRGQNSILVSSDLDWEEGDEIYLAPTAMQHDHSEYRKIVSYKNGVVTLDKDLDHYHWGDSVSTARSYRGVDMRGEVILLSRNIKIQGDDTDGWGGQVLATDLFESNGTWRKGQITFDNVQVYNCSQRNTFKAAIRFEGALGGSSSIRNSVVHNSLAWSLSIYKSNNVHVADSSFVGSRAIGVQLDFVRNVTLDATFTGDVLKRPWSAGDSFVDKEGCVAICSYMTQGSKCYDLQVTNNIAAGCKFGGFIAPGHDCNQENSVKFKDNVAHSSNGAGAYIYPDGTDNLSSKCYKGSHFTAYKNQLQCVETHYSTREIRMHDITCIDNTKGMNLQTAGDADDIKIHFYDSYIYGETESLDCPDSRECYCQAKWGFMLFGNNFGGKQLHPTSKSALPVYKIKSEGSWGGDILIDNVKFRNFRRGTTACANRQTVFQRNPYAADKIPMHKFKGCRFTDVDEQSLVWFDPSPLSWANPTDCGQWPCTAPENVVLSFVFTSFSGVTPPFQTTTFQLVGQGGPNVAGTYSNCESKMDMWNGYLCKNRNIGMLLFESLDSDTYDRSIQPINILNEQTGFNNTLNSYMDHVWDGFYTGQLRLSRFPAQVETNQDYVVEMAGTPPKKMRYSLSADIGLLKLKIPYPVAGSYIVKADGKKIDQNDWDKQAGRQSEIRKNKGCGENRYVGIENFLEFVITPGCEITVEPRDAIMTKVRLEWTLADFYADGGTTRFVDRLAASLGIHASRIKTVAVYEGSVIVDFYIEADESLLTTDSTNDLEVIKQSLIAGIENSSIDLGAEILGLQNMETGEVLSGEYIPGFEETKPTENTSSAIVGDSNLWDDLVVDRDSNITPNDNTTPSGTDTTTTTTPSTSESTSNTGGSSTQPEDQSSASETSSTTDEQDGKSDLARNQIVSVTVEEKAEIVITDEESTSSMLLIIPLIVVVVLVAVGILVLIKCYQSKKKTVAQIQENMHKQGHETDAGYVDSQYQLKPDDDKSNIFARTTVTNHKLRLADDVTNTEVEADAFGDSGNISASKFSSVSKLDYKNGEKTLGDSLTTVQRK